MGIYELSLYLGHTSVKTTEIYLAFLTTEEVMESKSVQRRVSYGRVG
jgi:integrase/recombinase XerD